MSDTKFLAWRGCLVDRLDRIKTAGDFSWTDPYDAYVNPGLELDGHGLVPLPLCPRDAQTIKQACRPAPFGKGDQTVVDEAVRKTWELDPAQFRLANPSWQAFLADKILAPASQRLGLVDASAKLHKLLLYEPGSFFKRHKDSEKEAGMVGTLVVCLPSEHEGGGVRLSFKGGERKYATGPASRFGLTALAWFGDVSHEVEELVSGYRLVLTYNIVLPAGSSTSFSASFFDGQTEEVRRALADWRATDRRTYRFYYPLDHQYSESSLLGNNLKGRDAAVCQLVSQTASAAGFCVFLASMTHRKERQEGDDAEGEDDEQETAIDKMYTCRGQLIAQNFMVDREEIPYPHLSYEDDDAADSEDEPEYLGNEDSPIRFRYHTTVVVIWSLSNLASLLGLNAGDVLVDELISEVARDFGNSKDKEAMAYATQFIKACVENPRHQPSLSMLPQLVEWGPARDHALYEAAVKAGRGQTLVQLAVARVVVKEHSKRADPRVFEAKDWDKWLSVFVKDTRDLTWLQSVLRDFSSNLGSPDLVASFRTWRDAALMTKLETKPQLEEADASFVIDVMLARHEDAEWLTTR